MTRHLDENRLLELSAGLLSVDALIEVEAHLDTCADCRRLLAEVMRSDADPTTNAHDLPSFPLANPDHFLISGEFARGGMGRIRLARDLRLGRVVALKEMLVDGPAARARFEREARITARLQHPSIVQVHEAGIWPTGERFYTMTRLEGRSLDAVAADAKTLDARLALLPNVLAVADAMAFAHSRGVVHRDLKPKNVLVGVYGETIVIDWGLAKDLATEADNSATTHAPSRGSGETTTAGEIFGTPAYMPREQALGNPVDARADVYAIGAMLHHVLAGRPPYAGLAPTQLLEAVRAGPPAALETLEPSTPPDLLAIVERAMAREAAGRYPSARELAEDLRRYLTGRLVGAHHYSLRQLAQRWFARHRAAVTIAAVALVVLAAVAGVSVQRIIRAERLAESRREKAEALIAFMVGDLNNKLEPIGRLDALESVATRAVGYYEEQPIGASSDEEQAQHARALRNLGDVRVALGDSASGLECYRAALALDAQLMAKAPNDLHALDELALDHTKLAGVLHRRGDYEDALAELRAGLEVERQAQTLQPEAIERKRALAATQRRLAEVLFAQDRLSDVEDALHAAQRLADDVARAEPLNFENRWTLSLIERDFGWVTMDRGDAQGALVRYRAALEIAQSLVEADGSNDKWQALLSGAHGDLGDAYIEIEDVSSALLERRAALAIDQRLSNKEPANAFRLRDLALDHRQIGEALQLQREVQSALTEFRVSVAISASLHAKDPTNQYFLTDLVFGHQHIGELLLADGDPTGALAAFRASLEFAERVPATSPDAPRPRVFDAHRLIGRALAAQGSFADALDETERMRAGYALLASSAPDVVGYQIELSRSHEQLGNISLAQGDFTAALRHFRAHLAIEEALRRRLPDQARHQRAVADAKRSVADALLAQGQPRDALALYEESLELKDVVPMNVELRLWLAVGHERLGDALVALKEPARARAEYDQALQLAAELRTASPGDEALGRQILELAARLKASRAPQLKKK